MPRWTKEEISILKENYGVSPIREWTHLLPNRPWTAIQNKASRIGLSSWIRGPQYKHETGIINGESLDELWEAAYAFQQASLRLRSRTDPVEVWLDVDYPIALAFIADLHIGAITVPLDHVRQRFEMMVEFDHLYAISAGDTTDNYLPQRHPQGMFSTMFPPEIQKELVIDLYRKMYGRWIALVQGCHEEFSHMTDDFDFTKYAAHQLDCANLGFGGLIKLTVGEQLYNIAVRHKYRYNSSLNPTHTCKRLVELEYPEADIACVAHHHRAAINQLAHRDKDRIYIRPGSLKGPDRFARSLGYTDTGSQIPVVILSPDKRQMLPYFDLDQALDAMRYLEGKK